MIPRDFEELCRAATKCRHCFKDKAIGAIPPMFSPGNSFDVAQPRYVGEEYWTTPTRVVLLLMNPGAGGSKGRVEIDATVASQLRDFRDKVADLQSIFDFQFEDMGKWSGGCFDRHYFDDRGLLRARTAILNVAWCPTLGTLEDVKKGSKPKPPASMLDACWERFTVPALALLKPHLVVAAGHVAQGFARRYQQSEPSVEVLECLHHSFAATRGGQNEENRRLVRARLNEVYEDL